MTSTYRSSLDNQGVSLNRYNRWLTGAYAPYESVATTVVDGTRLNRGWWVSPMPWVATKSYDVVRFRQWPGSYVVNCNFLLYGEAQEDGQTFVDPDSVLDLLNDISLGNAIADAQNASLDILGKAKWLAPVDIAELDDVGRSVQKLGRVFSGGHQILSDAMFGRRKYYLALYRRMRRFLTLEGLGRFLPWVTGTASQAWLGWRYAVQTTALSARDGAEAVAELMRDTPRLSEKALAHRTTSPVETTGEYSSGPLRSGHITTLYRSSSYSYTTWIESRAWITVVRQYNPVTDVPDRLGLLNWPANIWEMVPGSFIADWVLDLGSFLQRQSALVGWNVHDSGVSSTKRVAGFTQGHILASYPWTSEIASSIDEVRFEASHYQRSGWQSPAPVWTPAFNMNTNRWLDAAALCRGLAPLTFKR